ncbi:UNVERIFIED_CONTAM: hypothetical protein Sindi_1642000 [Sesamum indicum]
MNTMKDGEWLGSRRSRDHEHGKDSKQKIDCGRHPPYQPKYHRYIPLNTTRTKALLTVEKSDMLKWPRHTRFTPAKKFSSKYCKFHRERGHDTEERYQLKDEIEMLIRQGYFKEHVLKYRTEETVVRRSRSRSHERTQDRGKGVQREAKPKDNVPVKGIIYTIAGGPEGGDSGRSRKGQSRNDQRDQLVVSIEPEEEITFGNKDVAGRTGSQNDPMVIRLDIANFTVRKVLIDNGSSENIILRDVLGEGANKRRKLEVIEGGDEISEERTERIQPAEAHKIVEVIQEDPSKTTRIGSHLGAQLETMMQKKRNFSIEKNQVIREEVERLLNAGYISEVQYTEWSSNVVVVPKPGGKWRVYRNLPFFKVLRKTKNFEWTEEYEQAFLDLKTYLRSPPLLTNPKGNKVLYVYLVVSENAVSSALVREEEGVQSPIYYLSKMLQGAERRYAQIEKLALALVVTARKLRPYFQGHRIVVLTNHPLRNVLARPEASGPGDVEIEVAARLSFPVTNNEAEYDALIMGLELALGTGAKDLEVYTGSQLFALKIEGTYETKEESMILYHNKVKSIMSKFNKCQVHQIPRHKNDRADSLSKFRATLLGIRDRKITVMVRETPVIAENIDINVADEKPSWKDEIIRYMKEGILPADPTSAQRLKARAVRFTLVDEQLYKRTIEGPLLKCLDPKKAEYVMREIHEGSCRNHSGGRSLA